MIRLWETPTCFEGLGDLGTQAVFGPITKLFVPIGSEDLFCTGAGTGSQGSRAAGGCSDVWYRVQRDPFRGDRALLAPLRDHGQQQAAAGRPFAADTLGEGGMWRGAAWYQQRPSPQRLPELQMRVSLQQSARTRRTRARSRVAHLPPWLNRRRPGSLYSIIEYE